MINSRISGWRTPARLIAAVLITVLGTGWALTGTASAATLQPCSPSFIGIPGSNESNTNSPTDSAVLATVKADAAKAGVQLRNSTLLPYPAVPVTQYATLYSININNLGKSEASGESNLTALISAYRAASTAVGCPGAPILLAGYSQGAEVVIRTVDALPLAVRNTITIALLGNPSFIPNLSQDFDLSSTAYRGVRPSLLLGQRYNLQSDVIGRTIDLCAASDPICAYHISLVPALFTGTSAHLHYPTLTFSGLKLTDIAANYMWAHKVAASPVVSAPVTPAKPLPTGRIIISPCLNLRAGPNGSTALIGCIPDGVTISIQCTAQGNSVTGPYGPETIWDRTTYNGTTGYVSDAYVYTGTNSATAGAC